MTLFNFTTYGLLRRRILDVSNGIDEPGEIRLPLATTLFISWIAVFFCIHKGIKSSGKVNQENTVKKNQSEFYLLLKFAFSLCFFKNHLASRLQSKENCGAYNLLSLDCR